jgi:hypothetical protein
MGILFVIPLLALVGLLALIAIPVMLFLRIRGPALNGSSIVAGLAVLVFIGFLMSAVGRHERAEFTSVSAPQAHAQARARAAKRSTPRVVTPTMLVVEPEQRVVEPDPIVVPPPAPRVEKQPEPVVAPPAPKKALEPANVVDIGDGKTTAWQITGEVRTSAEEARQAALTLAQATVTEYLTTRELPIEWKPTIGYVADRLVKSSQVESTDFEGGVGVMYRATLTVRLTPENRVEIVRHDRELHVQDRMVWLGKLLFALVALLAAVAVYFRLDEMTKGYYTGWLRLAAAGFLGVAALVMVLLA